MPFDIEWVKRQVNVIEKMKGDAEGAHEAEDFLYKSLLGAIANGTCIDPGACAAWALTAALYEPQDEEILCLREPQCETKAFEIGVYPPGWTPFAILDGKVMCWRVLPLFE